MVTATRVLVIKDEFPDKYGHQTFQQKIDDAIAELGNGWVIAHAQTALCSHGGSSSNGVKLAEPKTFIATTLLMKKE